METHGQKNELTHSKLTKSTQNGYKMTKTCIHKISTISLQLAQTCMNLFLTHTKLLQDGDTLLKESLNTFKIDKIHLEWSQNDKNFHSATIKVLELASYTHVASEILTEWTQTAERMIYNL